MIGAMIVGIVNKTHLKVSRFGGIIVKNSKIYGIVLMISDKARTMNSLQIILITKMVEGQMAVMVEATTVVVHSIVATTVMSLDLTAFLKALIMTLSTVAKGRHITV